MSNLPSEAYAILHRRHSDPFHYLGRHHENGHDVVRVYLPEARDVEVIDDHGHTTRLKELHKGGLFAGELPKQTLRYKLRARYGDTIVELQDPYRFPPILTDYDLYLLGEGTNQEIYDKLGAHPITLEGIDGVGFIVLAPNARSVSVVGDFNYWDSRRHPMRVRGNGYWELFIPDVTPGSHYKFTIVGDNGQQLAQKADPFAFAAEVPPETASIVFDIAHLPRPTLAPDSINARTSPISIYEVHLGSWRRKNHNLWLSYGELAETLPAYVRDQGFTHVEFLPNRLVGA